LKYIIIIKFDKHINVILLYNYIKQYIEFFII